jgi:hypothetical protein
MLSLLAHNTGLRFCDGLTRREALQVGGIGTLGLGLPHLLQSQAAANHVGRAGASGYVGSEARRT